MVDALSSGLYSPSHGCPHSRSWVKVAVLPPIGGGPAPPQQQQLEVHGIFHHVGECHDSCDALHAAVVDCDGIDKSVLDQLL
jgi:hypothetical protein